MMLHIDSRKESKFTNKRSILLEILRLIFATETFYFNPRTDSHSRAYSISGVNPDWPICDSQVDSNSGADSDFGTYFLRFFSKKILFVLSFRIKT